MVATLVTALGWAPVLSDAASRQSGVTPAIALVLVTVGLIAILDGARRVVGRAIGASLGRARAGTARISYVYKWAGAITGIVRAGAAVTLVGIVLLLLPLNQVTRDIFGSAVVGRVFTAVLPMLPVGEGHRNLTPDATTVTEIDGRSNEDHSSLTLPFPPGTSGRLDSAAAAEFLAMTNLARAQSGLSSLAPESNLARVAGEHTLDMVRRAYFSHDSPDGATPSDRTGTAGVVYGVMAENIVFAPSLEAAFRSLMSSPTHRRKQLSADFRRVGIGVASVDRGVMVTVDFAD